MVPVRWRGARPPRALRASSSRPPVPARPAPRPGRPPGRAAATYRSRTPGACVRSVSRWARSVPTSPRVIGPGQRRPDAERPGVAERPLDERTVDRERPGLVESGHPAELGDRVEKRDEPARGEDRGGVVGRLRPGCQSDGSRPDRLGHVGQQRGQLVVALDRDRRPMERGDRPFRVGERDQRMERADLRPGGHRRQRGPRHRALRWCGPSPDRCTAGARRPTGRSRRRGRPG